MNLLQIAELRDRLKEDIAVIERFMDIVRREDKITLSQNIPKFPCTSCKRPFLLGHLIFLEESKRFLCSECMLQMQAGLPPTIEEQLREAANIRDANPLAAAPRTFKCDVCLREYPMQRLAPFDDLFGKAECLDCQETRRPLKAKDCKSC